MEPTTEQELRQTITELRRQHARLEEERAHALAMAAEAERSEMAMMAERDEFKRMADRSWQDNHVMDRIRKYLKQVRALEATMPRDELERRKIAMEIAATGLLKDHWDPMPKFDMGPSTVTWSRAGEEDGWLTIYLPDPNRSPAFTGDPTKFSVWAAFGSHTTDTTQIDGIEGATATEALVNAIESLRA